ncbi:hypothetical protein BC829DRAFT_106122 [Chytridium lagenaria]|nr:hypothetical protein BC829DRAFT_106122 [Chytridium lagenaria]
MSVEDSYLEDLLQSGLAGPSRPLHETTVPLMNWCSKALESKDLHQSLYVVMPSLCQYLFECPVDSPKVGVIYRSLNERDRASLCALLSPDSSLMRLLLRMSEDSSFTYEISLSRLPRPTQKIIEMGADRGKLPKLYQTRIVPLNLGAPRTAKGDSSGLRSTFDTSASSPSRHQKGSSESRLSSFRVAFNVLEYFLFSFAYVGNVSTKSGDANMTRFAHTTPASPSSGYTLSNTSFFSKSDTRRSTSSSGAGTADGVYFTLLSTFLRFFVPAFPVDIAEQQAQSPSFPPMSGARTPLIRKRSNLFSEAPGRFDSDLKSRHAGVRRRSRVRRLCLAAIFL